jgi:ATP synthase protein I
LLGLEPAEVVIDSARLLRAQIRLSASVPCSPDADLSASDPSGEDELRDRANNDLALPQVDCVVADSAPAVPSNGMDDFFRLQRRLLLFTLLLSAAVVAITAVVGSPTTAFSLLVGAISGFVYLWLLCRSVSRLGENSRGISKAQFLVPAVLVLVASKVPQLSILPALLGFLIYKPAVILQVLLDRSSASDGSPSMLPLPVPSRLRP